MFQKCPICDGTGEHESEKCPVCNGTRVIHTVTGYDLKQQITYVREKDEKDRQSRLYTPHQWFEKPFKFGDYSTASEGVKIHEVVTDKESKPYAGMSEIDNMSDMLKSMEERRLAEAATLRGFEGELDKEPDKEPAKKLPF